VSVKLMYAQCWSLMKSTLYLLPLSPELPRVVMGTMPDRSMVACACCNAIIRAFQDSTELCGSFDSRVPFMLLCNLTSSPCVISRIRAFRLPRWMLPRTRSSAVFTTACIPSATLLCSRLRNGSLTIFIVMALDAIAMSATYLVIPASPICSAFATIAVPLGTV